MNILILTKTFPETTEEWKGIFVKEQADAIASEHSVIVAKCSVDYNSFNPFFRYRVVSVQKEKYLFHHIIVSRSFPVYNQFNFIISTCSALKKIISENKPDLIHCHYSYPAGIVAWLIKRKKRIPYLVSEHTRIKQTFRSVFHRILSIKALRKADGVVAVSNALKNEIIAEGIRNVEIIPNVINTEKFRITEKSSEPFVIGFLGSLNNENKGLDILLSAVEEVPFNFKVKIGGTGTLLDHYKKYAEERKLNDHVIFTGEVKSDALNAFYSDINLFVLPSRYETFGIVLVEAMASGIPVVSTKCGGPSDIVNEKTGILVDVDDPAALREAIIKIHSKYIGYNPSEIREYSSSSFGTGAFMKRINTLYQSCLSK